MNIIGERITLPDSTTTKIVEYDRERNVYTCVNLDGKLTEISTAFLKGIGEWERLRKIHDPTMIEKFVEGMANANREK